MQKLNLSNLKRREKVLLVLAITISIFLIVNKLIIGPGFQSLNDVTKKYESKRLLLSKYYDFVSNENWYTEKLNSLRDEYNVLKGKILDFETEELASAKLQEIVKNIARSNGLSISKSIAAKKNVIRKDPYLIFISANFEINHIKEMGKLKSFLYDLEYNNEKLFFVKNLKIKGIGIKDIQGISVITTLAVLASINKG